MHVHSPFRIYSPPFMKSVQLEEGQNLITEIIQLWAGDLNFLSLMAVTIWLLARRPLWVEEFKENKKMKSGKMKS